MKGDHILYRGSYKYQLVRDYEVQTDILPPMMVDEEFIKLDLSGKLRIVDGYAWDGPSGPTIDTPDFMRGSLVHDALYQLMRDGHLDEGAWRDKADRLLEQICLEDGMSHFRAEYVYQGVRLFGAPSADPQDAKAPIEAP
jgi:hypothetical protein